MRFIAEAEIGLPIDDTHNIHPNTLGLYLGAGDLNIPLPIPGDDALPYAAPSDEMEDVVDQLGDRITEDQAAQIRHDPVPCPENESPFDTHDAEVAFWHTLHGLAEQEFIPEGYLLTADELESLYPEFETIPLGKRGKQEVDIALPTDIWWPRALLWSQALHLLTVFQDIVEE